MLLDMSKSIFVERADVMKILKTSGTDHATRGSATVRANTAVSNPGEKSIQCRTLSWQLIECFAKLKFHFFFIAQLCTNLIDELE